MRKIHVIFFLLFSSTWAFAQSSQVIVKIQGFESNKGSVKIGLYNKKENFLKKYYKGANVKISSQEAVYSFKNVPHGEYAISIFHDENMNGELDTNFFGIPIEGYGCSNNAKGFFGPPKWNDAKFKLKTNTTINIKL